MQSLPIEILARIAAKLTDQDKINFACTSKTCRDVLAHVEFRRWTSILELVGPNYIGYHGFRRFKAYLDTPIYPAAIRKLELKMSHMPGECVWRGMSRVAELQHIQRLEISMCDRSISVLPQGLRKLILHPKTHLDVDFLPDLTHLECHMSDLSRCLTFLPASLQKVICWLSEEWADTDLSKIAIRGLKLFHTKSILLRFQCHHLPANLERLCISDRICVPKLKNYARSTQMRRLQHKYVYRIERQMPGLTHFACDTDLSTDKLPIGLQKLRAASLTLSGIHNLTHLVIADSQEIDLALLPLLQVLVLGHVDDISNLSQHQHLRSAAIGDIDSRCPAFPAGLQTLIWCDFRRPDLTLTENLKCLKLTCVRKAFVLPETLTRLELRLNRRMQFRLPLGLKHLGVSGRIFSMVKSQIQALTQLEILHFHKVNPFRENYQLRVPVMLQSASYGSAKKIYTYLNYVPSTTTSDSEPEVAPQDTETSEHIADVDAFIPNTIRRIRLDPNLTVETVAYETRLESWSENDIITDVIPDI